MISTDSSPQKSQLSAEAVSGILLLASAALALFAANGPWAQLYDGLLGTPVSVAIGEATLAKPLLLWINDGLMAVFFLMIGLEVRREMTDGALATWSQRSLPLAAAAGGMVVPAAIFIAVNWGDRAALDGWAVPVATDIAFALGILALAGDRIPGTLKIFLLALAIFDDLGAILIIALLYSRDLSATSLGLASVTLVVLLIMNRLGVKDVVAYVLVGVALWLFVLKSGVHATLAGVVLAFAIPYGGKSSPAYTLEKALHTWVSFLILPVFAFANAGVDLGGLALSDLGQPVTLGVILGLVVGKQIGILAFTWLAVATGFCRRPEGASWVHLYGIAALCGVGFTMSLFVGSLAFEHLPNPDLLTANRLGILVGSALAGSSGFLLLRFAPSVNHGSDHEKSDNSG
ncbi:MAG: Na+/H+ antiporter NhaA [Thermoanaerobaculia bacterium]|nr:Na+/H+ antiporter NhaA [Thermoanaerobaculia bacterium]